MKTVLVGLALAGLIPASARPQSQTGPGVQLVAVRFYRPTAGQTLVDVLTRVPFAVLDPLTREAGGGAAYRFAVTVRDSAGLELLQQSWTGSVPARLLSAARGSAAEHFSFAARPGKYTITVTVTDSATGRVTREQGSVVAYDRAPAASDLMLATGARQAANAAETPRTGEVRKGGVLLEVSSQPVLTPQRARLSYYLELYRERAETVTVVARVKARGSQLVATPAERIAMGAGGGMSTGTVDLSGLPPGEYEFELQAAGTADTVVRRAPFRMAGFETEAAIAEAAPVQDRFATMADAQLDTVYLPLVYLMTSDEQGSYTGLSLDGKRRWLRQFWTKRDPTPGTPENEAQEDFYRRIAEANRRFREGGAAEVPGWRTDRGRIFVKYGPPNEELSRPQSGNARPYVVWKYTRGRALKYVFLDQTQFGNYALIYTDDRREPSRPNWQELLGPDAVIDVQRFD